MVPDSDKILYYTKLCKNNSIDLVDVEQVVQMYNYILNYTGKIDYSIDKRRLEYIFIKIGIKGVV